MSKRPFREHHLLQLLEAYEEQRLPLDRFIADYFRANKALGSKDRAMISEAVYGMVRWKGLLDALCEKPINWEKRWRVFQGLEPSEHQHLPPHVQVSFPKTLFDLIGNSDLCLVSNTPAPTTVRVNTLKTSRNEMLKKWDNYEIRPCLEAKNGIIFEKKINFFVLPEFKEGLFEIQDEGSQLLAEMMDVKPGQHVMDYCSGSGGKALAFAPKMEQQGQIYLHDIRPHILVEAKRRLKRAGIQNAQIVPFGDPKLKKLKKKMDWVLVDAPCSGTGTLRRNPDMKWKFTPDMVKRLVGEQRQIFEKALSYLKPDGHILYATCSLLKEENQEQVAHFLKTYNLEIVGTPFQSLPNVGGMDGFFGAIMTFAKRASL